MNKKESPTVTFEQTDFFAKSEELNYELRPFVTQGIFPMIQHPFLYSVPYFEIMNPQINRMYEQKKMLIQKAKKEKNWNQFVFLYERPYRLEAFVSIQNYLKPKEYWELLADIWVDSENIWQNKATYKKLFSKHRDYKKYFMNSKERKYFDSLPEQIVAYRGYVKGQNRRGFSYTLDKKQAEWFAKRFDNDGSVAKIVVPKSRVLAYTNRRGEKELIIL